MRASSTDHRERVVAACDEGDATREQVAARFAVSVSWIRKLLKQRRDTGSIAPKRRRGGRAPAFDAEAAARLREAVRPSDILGWFGHSGYPTDTSTATLNKKPH